MSRPPTSTAGGTTPTSGRSTRSSTISAPPSTSTGSRRPTTSCRLTTISLKLLDHGRVEEIREYRKEPRMTLCQERLAGCRTLPEDAERNPDPRELETLNPLKVARRGFNTRETAQQPLLSISLEDTRCQSELSSRHLRSVNQQSGSKNRIRWLRISPLFPKLSVHRPSETIGSSSSGRSRRRRRRRIYSERPSTDEIP